MKHQNKNQKIKIKSILKLLILFFMLISSLSIVHSLLLLTGIETLIRLLIIIIIILLFISLTINFIKKKKLLVYSIIIIIYSIILLTISYTISKAYNKLNKITTSSTIYSTSLITLNENDIDSIDDITKGKIGLIEDATNIIGNIIPKEIIKEKKITNEIVEYNNYITLFEALINGKIDYAFAPTNYKIMFQNTGIESLDNLNNTKILYTKQKEIKSKQNSSKSLTEPITILLMGVDSEQENISSSSFNGDSLMLLTFNPLTLTTTMLSIPRDSYVPIACFENNRSNKITHAAWYGETCMIETIQNYFDIKIDYYVKINFKGLVKLVDNLGGIDVDVEYKFCEQNSNRMWGENTIYVEKGLQTLNGEQALAYARNRHPNPLYCTSEWTNYVSNDFIRGRHQQDVLKALLNKLQTVKKLDTIYNLLNTISNNMETNMTTSEILSLYNIGKDILAKAKNTNIEDLLSIKKMSLSGIDAYIYDPYLGATLYDFVIYEESQQEIIHALKVNLGKEKEEVIKTFSFSIENPYEEKIIGIGDFSKLPDYEILPDFIGDTEMQARYTARNLGISYSIKYVEKDEAIGKVISQNYPAGTPLKKIDKLVLTISKKKENTKSYSTTTKQSTISTTKKEETTSSTTTKIEIKEPEEEDDEVEENEIDAIIPKEETE